MNETIQPSSQLETVFIHNEKYFKISDVDRMRPFFMSIVSDSNHWMFISSNGALTAGRKNAQFALFPYYTDDKITEYNEITGCKTIIKTEQNGQKHIWEPFSVLGSRSFKKTRNLYKNQYGHKIIFEEINHDLQLTFRYTWASSNSYGFVRTAELINNTSSAKSIELLDGLQNIIPYGVGSDIQNNASNLVDAYKRSELEPRSGIGIFALSAIIVDRAEPSEALKANTVWQSGLDNATRLLSSKQLGAFRHGHSLREEQDIKAEKAAYFLVKQLQLEAQASQTWYLMANVNQDHSAVAQMIHDIIEDKHLLTRVLEDVDKGTRHLIALNASADGLQHTADELRDARHFANVLFNNMRGGIFDHNYSIEKWDFMHYLQKANSSLSESLQSTLSAYPKQWTVPEFKTFIGQVNDVNFTRLAIEYLPLKFSRRHGDPSRPWNKFSINTRNEKDGSKVLDYEGNWRDIFQNWEALSYSFPQFIEGMIFKFLNASTFDGYNPYRVTKGGFDWETIEEDNPWSYIGYWGDHQIIYFQKFLECIEKHYPSQLDNYFNEEIFVYADVPYIIKSYSDILRNPKDTIEFDHDSDKEIRHRRDKQGADGALLRDQKGHIHHVNFVEKILASLLAKLSNFIPEGGIWMNTQRPEWNDANNALVGNGVSMVTLYYLRRNLQFLLKLFSSSNTQEAHVSEEMYSYFNSIYAIFEEYAHQLNSPISDRYRKSVMDQLGQSADEYRSQIYQSSFSGTKKALDLSDICGFISFVLAALDHSILSNKREDGLYHAYNLVHITEDQSTISFLSEMLEGQVAVLSSSYLNAEEALKVLDALKVSALFREDQYSYILYPNKSLPGFLNKNSFSEALIQQSDLLAELSLKSDQDIIKKDINGQWHFNGDFRNAEELRQALTSLNGDNYSHLDNTSVSKALEVYEQVFNHKEFTGRSGTFFGYEGLGSIYWHMVSKLLLAVQEVSTQAIDDNIDPSITGRLLEHFYEILEGIGVHKSPQLYGAFPTDPYSHTPGGKGAQQPGMTGQVKEDILSRWGELGVTVNESSLIFNPCLLRSNEFIMPPSSFHYYNIEGQESELQIPAQSLAFLYCQTPVIYSIGDVSETVTTMNNGEEIKSPGTQLSKELSQKVFERSNEIQKIHVFIQQDILK